MGAFFMITQWVILLRRLKPAATGHSFVLLEESLNLGVLLFSCQDVISPAPLDIDIPGTYTLKALKIPCLCPLYTEWMKSKNPQTK